jgi:hypothetical protein
MTPHSPAFIRVRDLILALDDDRDRARLAALFCHVTQQHRDLGELRRVLRAIGELDDGDLERLAKWFSQYMNHWGQTPKRRG